MAKFVIDWSIFTIIVFNRNLDSIATIDIS
jgi:hypothetical protein